MTSHIRQCPIDLTYTLLKICPKCGTTTESVHPARYSPQDRYGNFRRIVRKWNK